MRLIDPTTITALPRHLLIDIAIVDLHRAGKLHPRWSSATPPIVLCDWNTNAVMSAYAGLGPKFRAAAPAILFGRRALEVATTSALMETGQHNEGDIIADWNNICLNATEARKATNALLLDLSANHLPLLGSRSLVTSLYYMDRRGEPVGDFPLAETSAKKKADALTAALATMRELEHFAATMRDTLAKGRDNPGTPEKNAFVLRMAEAWSYLVGKKPGKGSSRNPFLEFAVKAWEDVGGSPEDSLINAIRKAASRAPASDHPPEWI